MKEETSVKITTQVRLDAYRIISDAIESGLRFGWNRAHKHTDDPGQDLIIDQMHSAVMNELCEILKFDEGL